MADAVETLLREVLAGQAGQAARMEDLASQLRLTQEDAREARDTANRISTILSEQNIVARLVEHKREVRGELSEIRQDFVAANVRVRNDVETLEKDQLGALGARIAKLEADLQQREGVKSLATWLMRNAPWLFAGIAAFAAGLGFKDKLP